MTNKQIEDHNQNQRNRDYSEKRVVAFLDLLGFKELIKNGEQNKIDEVLDFLYEIRKVHSSFNVHRKPSDQAGFYTIEMQPEFISSNDHMIISIPFRETGIGALDKIPEAYLTHALSTIGEVVTNLYLFTLKIGIGLRGAIAFGKQYYDSNADINVGKPLIEAVETEQNLSNFPRVVATKSLLEELEKHWIGKKDFILDEFQPKFLFPPLRRDFDGMYFFDYLYGIFHHSFATEENLNMINEIRCQIENNMRTNDPRLLAKWGWLANYFDATLKTYVNHEKFSKVKSFSLLAFNRENVSKIFSQLGLVRPETI